MHYIRTVVADLIGPYATPAVGGGFKLLAGSNKTTDFGLSQGRIYVDGLLVENDREDASYLNQPDYDSPPPLERGLSYLAYLDVWEDHVTALGDLFVLKRADFSRILRDHRQFADTMTRVAKERYELVVSSADLTR